MSIINGNISIKIKEVRFMTWDIMAVSVAPRPYHALVLRLCGSASFSHDNVRLSTNTGDVLYMPADYYYNATYEEKNEILVIHFESDLVSKMENYHLNNPHIISLLFRKLYDIWNDKADGYYFSALSVLCEILENISLQQASVLQSDTINSFENAIEYMEKFYTQKDFSINKMIEKSYMSHTYFRKLFCDKFNVTPAKYLTTKRVIYAEKLLSTGKYSIKEVAEMSGFSDVKYFSRVIKKEYGIAPSKLYQHIINHDFPDVITST